MAELDNPAIAGPTLFDTVIYASAGSNYAGVPASSQYTIYDTPDAALRHAADQHLAVCQSRHRRPVALPEHERAAQRAHLHSARPRAVPA